MEEARERQVVAGTRPDPAVNMGAARSSCAARRAAPLHGVLPNFRCGGRLPAPLTMTLGVMATISAPMLDRDPNSCRTANRKANLS
jgi:hypothetical protein